MSKRSEKYIGTVYSTEHGKMCPSCGNPISNCNCREKKNLLQPMGLLEFVVKRKGVKERG